MREDGDCFCLLFFCMCEKNFFELKSLINEQICEKRVSLV